MFLESRASLDLLSTFKRIVAFVSGSIKSEEMEIRMRDQALLDMLPAGAEPDDFKASRLYEIGKEADKLKRTASESEAFLSKEFVAQTSRLFEIANKEKEQGLEKLRGSNGLIDANKLKAALAEVTQKIDDAGQRAMTERQKSKNKRGGFLADTSFGLVELLLKNDMGSQKAGIVSGLRIAFQEMEEGNNVTSVKNEMDMDVVTLPWSKAPIDLTALSDKEREHVWMWNEMLLVLFTELFEKPEVFLGRGAALVLSFLEEDDDGVKLTLLDLCARKGIKVDDGATDEELYICLLESLSSSIVAVTATGLIGGGLGIAFQVWILITFTGWVFSLFSGDGGNGDVAMTAADLASFSGNTPAEAPGLFSGGLELLQKLLGGGNNGGFGI